LTSRGLRDRTQGKAYEELDPTPDPSSPEPFGGNPVAPSIVSEEANAPHGNRFDDPDQGSIRSQSNENPFADPDQNPFADPDDGSIRSQSNDNSFNNENPFGGEIALPDDDKATRIANIQQWREADRAASQPSPGLDQGR
jgi:hypothetical protein